MQPEADNQEFPEQMPDLFHKSSLRQRTDPLLEIVADEIYEVKRWIDSDGRRRINDYIEDEELGRGQFGIVYKVIKNNNYFAMKSYSRIGLRKQKFFAPDGDFADALEMLDNQLNIVKRLNHPNLIRTYEILYGSDYIYIVMDLGNLGQIMKWSQLEEKYSRNLKVYEYLKKTYKTEDLGTITKIIFTQVCLAIQYLHNNNITNRDIKVENILCLTSKGTFDDIKVIDFTTTRYSLDDISYFPSGTPGFRGPQHQFAGYQGYSCKASDIWSIGISLYVYYYQTLPFYGENQLQIDIKAKNNELVFSQGTPEWLIKFVNKTTAKNWKERVTISEALQILKEEK